MLKVVHIMRKEFDVAVDRSSKWGNPYSHKLGTWAKYTVPTKKEAIEKYREYICSNKELLECLGELRGKVLGCWCAGTNDLTTANKPYICHGQILLELLEQKYPNDEQNS